MGCLNIRNLFCVLNQIQTVGVYEEMRVTTCLFVLGLVALSIGSVFWLFIFVSSLNEYELYCETVAFPVPYHVWEEGKYVNIVLIALFFLWIPFIVHFLRTIYPFLRRKTFREVKSFSRFVSRLLYEILHRIVLGYFTRVNKRVRAKISLWFMKLETFEHLHLLIKVFKWIVLPSSVIYGLSLFIFFRQNALFSILLANLLFFYSNFVPDLPAIFRRKVYRDERDALYEKLPAYKAYTLLLFAPVFIVLLFCGIQIKWKTTKTFHDFKSLAVYGAFLLLLCFLVVLVFQLSLGGIIEVLCIPLFGMLGYLTHLRVDLVF